MDKISKAKKKKEVKDATNKMDTDNKDLESAEISKEEVTKDTNEDSLRKGATEAGMCNVSFILDFYLE